MQFKYNNNKKMLVRWFSGGMISLYLHLDPK